MLTLSHAVQSPPRCFVISGLHLVHRQAAQSPTEVLKPQLRACARRGRAKKAVAVSSCFFWILSPLTRGVVCLLARSRLTRLGGRRATALNGKEQDRNRCLNGRGRAAGQVGGSASLKRNGQFSIPPAARNLPGCTRVQQNSRRRADIYHAFPAESNKARGRAGCRGAIALVWEDYMERPAAVRVRPASPLVSPRKRGRLCPARRNRHLSAARSAPAARGGGWCARASPPAPFATFESPPCASTRLLRRGDHPLRGHTGAHRDTYTAGTSGSSPCGGVGGRTRRSAAPSPETWLTGLPVAHM
jgi:hypothetical protein